MKLTFAVGFIAGSFCFGNGYDISTYNGFWQVSGPGVTGSVASTSLDLAGTNGAWAPTGPSLWRSWGAQQGTSCVIGQTPGDGCANPLFNPSGDIWTYTLTLSASDLEGATSGTLNFVFGGDTFVTLAIGNEPVETWNQGGTLGGFGDLGCSGNPPASAGNSPASYQSCVNTVSFASDDLIGGALTLTATVTNSPIPGCPACGDPTGFVLQGELITQSPEPGTFVLVCAAGFALLSIRRCRNDRVR